MKKHVRSSRYRWYADIPSALFVLAVTTNTILICRAPSLWLLVPLTCLQALLMVGCQEAKHLSVHGTFFHNRRVNDAVGIACAALFGVNFVSYRYFHFAHHRATCTEADPEGRLYSLSWRTRWIWLLAPIELPWVAWHIGRTAWPMVPAAKRLQRHVACLGMATFGLSLVTGLLVAPLAIVCAYLIPLTLFSWFDFLLTQAEHYGVAVAPPSSTSTTSHDRNTQTLSHDIVLPLGLGWLTLHRSLHAVHHANPALRWFEAPRALKRGRAAERISYAAFARRWFASGPRLWLTAQGERANATIPGSLHSARRS
jgi:fatty acid desaturase